MVASDGTSQPADLVRVGSFNIVADGDFLRLDDGRLYPYPRQPKDALRQTARAFAATGRGLAPAVRYSSASAR